METNLPISKGLFFGMLVLIYFALQLECSSAQETTQTQAISSSNGQEFFIGFMQNFNAISFGSLQLTIGTTLTNVVFVVEYGDGVIHTGTVSSDSPAVIEIPNDFQVSDSSFENREKGVHVYAMDESTIFVIVENFVSPFNHGVFLAYPCLSFETDDGYEYFVISTEGSETLHSQVLLIGCEENTDISITPSQMVSLPENLQSETSASVDVEVDSTQNLTINQLQTFLISSSSDLTGTRILSNKPLTVISGHECATVLVSPGVTGGCEPFAVQVPPTITWGTRFLLGNFGGRNDLYIESIYKIVTSEMASVLIQCGRLNDTLGITLLPRTSFSFAALSSRYCSIQSSHPILVVQKAANPGDGGRGDPAIALISPIDQYVNEVSFFVLPWEIFFTNFITVTVEAEYFNPTSIFFDGETIDCEWTEIFNATGTLPIGYGCDLLISTSPDNSTHTLHTVSHESENGQISVLVYGFNDASGYAYLAGQEITQGNSGGINTFPEETTIPYFDITIMLGVMELRRVVDAVSQPIYIPNGLIFGDKLTTSAYVSENGVISFDEPWRFSYPNRFPTNYFHSRQSMVIAPFWSDNDIRREGTVRYSTFCTISNKAECPESSSESYQESVRIMNTINEHIQTTRDPEFTGTWLLIAQWDQVHPSPHGDDDRRGISEDILSKTNTYQGIVISNVYRSYGVFTYGCGDIQWSSITNGQGAVIGYNAAANYFFNHRSSGYIFVGNSVSCTATVSQRKKRQVSRGNVVVTVNGNARLQDLVRRCFDIQTADEKVSTDGLNLHYLYPCPSSRSQANEDNARFRPQENLTQCYLSMNIIEGVLAINNRAVSPTQQCCYDENGALVTNPDQGYVGTWLLQHPNREHIAYEREFTSYLVPYGDKTFRDACCDERLNNKYCDIFFSKRNISTDDGYLPPASAIGSGDPHYRPFDFNTYHHFQGVGHFIILNLASLSQNVPDFSIHGHLCRLGSSGVTWHSRLAFGNSRIAFELGRLPGFQVRQTKPMEADLTQLLEDEPTWSSPNGYVELVRLPRQYSNLDTIVAFFFEYGIKISIDVWQLRQSYRYTNYQVWVPLTYAGRASGLLGNLDGNNTNDYFERGQETNPLPHYYSDSELYDHWLTWTLSTGESLFANHPQCPDEFRRKRQVSYAPITPDQLNFTSEQRRICEGNLQCLFDFVVSGEEEVGLATLTHEKEANSSIEILNNYPPNITAESTFSVTVSQESIFYLSVNDSRDNFTLSVLGGIPSTSVLEELSRGEFVFRWTLQEITYNPLIFLANDSRGAASLYAPRVEVCNCFNDGNCTLDGILSDNATVVLNCVCTQAFDGRFCEEDRNGCSKIQCFEGVECMDVPAPGVGAVCGTCPPGYTGDALKCYDIDECFLNRTLCDHNCTNTDGGYLCSCFDGYQLIEETSECEDINECNETSECQQICENIVGSYVCNCTEGFTLATDRRNCTANVPCNGTCSFGCAVVNNMERCYCPLGFQLDVPGGTQCVDTNECQMNNLCEQECINSDGSFSCSCTAGYMLTADGGTCQDIDECFLAVRESNDLCENYPNSECVNYEGSFECVCVPGYTANSSGICELNDELPPRISVIRPQTGIENSVNFTSPILVSENFSPKQQQVFREVTAAAVNSYCWLRTCDLLLSSGEIQILTRLTIKAANVAIPSSLICQDINGQLLFTFYVQVGDAFLSKEYLESAVQQAEELYRDAGLLQALSLLTAPPPTDPITTPRSTTMIKKVLDDTQIIAIAAGAGGPVLLIMIVLLLLLLCYCKYKYQNQRKGVVEVLELQEGATSLHTQGRDQVTGSIEIGAQDPNGSTSGQIYVNIAAT